jgi:hypothetical protein
MEHYYLIIKANSYYFIKLSFYYGIFKIIFCLSCVISTHEKHGHHTIFQSTITSSIWMTMSLYVGKYVNYQPNSTKYLEELNIYIKNIFTSSNVNFIIYKI